MKIKVELTIDVDGFRWYSAGGEGPDPATVRDDVRRYITTSVAELERIGSSGAKVEPRQAPTSP